MVAEWTRDIRRRRDVAEARLQAHRIDLPRRLNADEVETLAASLGGVMQALRATPSVSCTGT